MSAAQRLDEVFGLPEGSEVYVLNDFKSSAYDAVRLFETWASTSFAISRFTPVRRMKVLRARLSRLANTTINVTICRGALKRRISTMKVEMIYLSQEDVIRCGGMSMDKAVDDLEEVFRLYDKGDYILPGKIVMKRPEPNAEETTGRINAMPGYIGGRFNMPGIKWIGSGPQNPFKYGLPRGSAVIVLNDPETKVPIAIMDGTLISAIRTGAVTGVCAKYMAPSRSKTVGLFGAGPQCKTQLMALKASLPQLEKAYVYDLSRERTEKFAAEMSQKLNMDVQAASDRLATIESGDILVTATTATEQIIHGAEIKKGVYVAHLGNNEVDEELILRADKVVIDDWETDKHRMGDTMAYMFRDGKIDDSRIDASVSDLVAGRKSGRDNDDQLTYTCNVGLGLYDVAIAARVYQYAKENGIGQKLKLWDEPIMV